MKRFVVNVIEQKITPYVVEANDEWEAMIKAKDGEGYISEAGPVDLQIDPTSWEVTEFNHTELFADWF
jgi:hypothetical protein